MVGGETKVLSKAQKKNEKRRQKKKDVRENEDVRDNWDSEEESEQGKDRSCAESADASHANAGEKNTIPAESADADAVAEKLSKLDVQ